MFDPWFSVALFITAVMCSLINKFFFMKDGFMFKLNGIFPKKIGNREVHSKWAFRITYLTTTISLIWFVDMFMRFIQQEADKIQQQIGNLP